MLEVKIYGKPSSLYEYIKTNVTHAADKAHIGLNLKEIISTDKIIENKIMSIPAVEINGEIIQRGKRELNDYLEELNTKIMQIENYGNMRRIIVPVDFSTTADNAVNYAFELSQHIEGAVIQIIHVYHPSPPTANGITYIDPKIEELRRDKFRKYVEKVNLKFNIGAKSQTIIDGKFLVGFAAKEIVRYAQEFSNAIVVLGSNGANGTFKKLFGSVSTSVALNGKTPVLIVPPQVEFKRIKKVAYAINKNVMDDNVAAELKSFIKPFNSRLDLVHINCDKEQKTLNDIYIPKRLKKGSVYYHNLCHEDVSKGIYKYCDQNDVDLISLSPDRRGFLSSIFHQSVTKSFTISTNKPLLIIPIKV